MPSPVRIVGGIARWTLACAAALLCLVVLAILLLQTGWAKDQLRTLIVRQANQYLTATLAIDRLEGSLFQGVRLSGIHLTRNGQTLIGIDAVDVSYSIRELVSQGTLIRRISVTRPVVTASRLPDGRWDLATLIKRDAEQGQSKGPGRPLHIRSIEVVDGSVSLIGGLTFGIARVPTEFRGLNARFAFDYAPVTWKLDFEHASWRGQSPSLDVEALSGVITNAPDALQFEDLLVQTPRSRVLVSGAINRNQSPSTLALNVNAERFAFAEWGGIVPTVANIAIEGPFTAVLRGPVKQLDTTLNLSSTGGGVAGTFTIDTTAPGWRAAGSAKLRRLNLAMWLSRPDDASDITGDVTFDIGMPPGSHFPRGTYAFDGSHARFMAYEADDVVAEGRITATDVQIAHGTATAYGANVRLDRGSIGIDAPFAFTFAGLVNGIDLRQLPASVPVPHVESTLHFDYEVNGQFRRGFLQGRAAFHESSFLGIAIGEGTVGAIDTLAQPFTYSGEGDLREIDLRRLGEGLNVAWMQEPRYAGVIEGRFHVEGAGSEAATMRLVGGGHIQRARLFQGELTNADVSIDITDGTLTGSYDGTLTHINPALAMNDERYAATLTGTGRGRVVVRDLMRRSASLDDYTVDASLALTSGTEIRGIAFSKADFSARLADSTLVFDRLDVIGPSIEGGGSGSVALDGRRSSDFSYDIRRAELPAFRQFLGAQAEGRLVTAGRLTGPLGEMHVVGQGTIAQFRSAGVSALSTSLRYDATIPTDAPQHSRVSADGTVTFVEGFGQQFKEIAGSVTYQNGQSSVDLTLTREGGLTGTLTAAAQVDMESRTVVFGAAALAIDRSAWRLAQGDRPARVTWNERGVQLEGITLVDAGGGAQQFSADGTWYPSTGGGSLRIVARQISIDALFASDAAGGPSRYGGTLDADATIAGTRAQPMVTGTVTVVEGRIWRTSYERLEGTIGYSSGDILIDLRLDQSPGVWLTAAGRVPSEVLSAGRSAERSMSVEIHSSSVSLGLLEGVTDVVRNVSGQLQLNVTVVGTLKDPHFTGRVDIADAAFQVAATGSRYRKGRVALQLATHTVTVESIHVEDQGGHALDVTGALATHELRVGDLQVAVKARDFEVLRNEFGRMDIDADLNLQGQFESPRLEGRVAVSRGELQVDSVLDRTLFRPYSTAAAAAPTTNPDAIAALNPWDRLGIRIDLHVPGTLRLVGDNIQVSPGTPLGLGAVNLRAIGDLYFYKDPSQPLYVTGSLDQVTGTYAFQGRRFELDPISSINFRGDFNPDLYVAVEREISSVTTRVTIQGLLSEPELRLSSTPPLDPSDILSLIVFNTSTNELTSAQQQQLAGRAATIAAGFLAAPILTAIEQSLGLDTLEIAPASDASGGTRVTIGNEIAPGLVARFSRQFGEEQYDEATIEYFLSRLFRLRATFSDANSLGTRTPFRRVERAGIDFLVFFSF